MKKITNITELKDGMKVRGSYYCRVFYDGVIYLDFDERICLKSTEIGYNSDIAQVELDNHSFQLFTIDDDELVVREGDVIEDKYFDKYYVLGVSGCVAHISYIVDHKASSIGRTFHELHTRGFKIVTDKPETIQIDGKTYKKSDIDSLTPIL